jgi:hypothetical protein
MSGWSNTDALASKPKVLTKKVTFDASSTSIVGLTPNTIVVPSHGFITGDAVAYGNGGGTAIVGLTSGTTYYAIRVDVDTVKLATSLANAVAGTAVDITAVGVGTAHTLQKTASDVFFVDATEAGVAANRAKGITGPGWWRIVSYTDSGSVSRNKVECLIPLYATAANAGDASDDSVVADA